MDKKILFLFVGILILVTGCSAEKYGMGIDAGAPVIMVKDIVLKPELQGRNVTIEGRISSQCQSNGCWFVLQDDTGQVFVNLQPGNFALPSRMGKRVRVTGVVATDQQGYQIIARGVEVK
ncbi:MAG: OB-fold nucleic acid binding domain-containing protein [Alphaproteobacteria bacterium]|uniref:OB-fold nucleic acid binding domain-containing protein n=1 Tax=Candidatus Nitrobium versatile TaxID=2884831 RepID=A0A953M1K0_9BACT|nr:OB-fold nucleic acid binding domain-containing protein [Candidatus Nitrobium versatile]